MNDLRFALRQLAKNPGFTVVAVLTLALGIGANTAIFSFVNAILLRPLPYKNPDALVMVYENELENGWHQAAIGAPVLGQWRSMNSVFEGIAARGETSFVFSGRGQPETLHASRLSANGFSLLGIMPFLGRDFLPAEETYGKHHVAILSYELYQRRFGGDPQIIDKSITLDSEPYTVIGVMPARTYFPDPSIQIWTPLAFSASRLAERHAHSYNAFARLKPGVMLEQARADMNLVANRMAAANAENKGWGAEVYPLQEITVGDSRRLLYTLLGAVGLVLLIGCANIANLLLARGAARAREFAIRAALGAGRWKIIRQLMAESLLLALFGAVGGAALAALGLDLLIRFSPPDLPRVAEGIPLDGATLGFTGAISLITGLAFGIFPAIQWSKPGLAGELNSGARGSSGNTRQRTRAALVIGEVALSLMLLAAGGLMIRSFERLVSQKLGFKPEHLVTATLDLPDKKYPSQEVLARFFEQFLDRVRSIPGVDSAAFIDGLPLSGNWNGLAVQVPGATPYPKGEGIAADYSQISENYFQTMGTPLLQGRDFTKDDRISTTPALIVNEAFVKEFRLGSNVIGRQIKVGDRLATAEIVGVVASTKRNEMSRPARSEMFRMYKQISWGSMHLLVRTQRAPSDILRAIRTELDVLDKDQPLANPTTMTKMIASAVAQRRLSVQLFAGFAGIALLLAAIGLYGLLAYLVSQRRQEIGIRMALGAQRAKVLSMVLKQGMLLAGIGIVIGLAGAFSLAGVMRHFLFETAATEPETFAAITLVLFGVALTACWFPARRATQVDPMVALRSE